MHLISLEVAGFKSFAQQTTLRFDRGLTAIIGPNGSGKSNLAETIKWVLGEQSIRHLRGQRSEDVIYAGFGSRRAASSAHVTLTLSNEDGRFPHPAAEIALSRMLTKDSESDYLLNADQVRLFDLQHMLAHAGIGTKSYTVIHQGTINRYLEATPLARRELFDEATGIRGLQLKLTKTQRQLEQTRQQSRELAAIFDELQPRLRVLERQILRYQKRQELEHQFQQLQERWFHQRWHFLKDAVLRAQKHVEATSHRIQSAQAARQHLEKQLWHTLEAHQRDETIELTTQIREAQTTYDRLLAEYQQKCEEKAHLEALVQEAHTARLHAEQILATARQRLAQESWLVEVRAILLRCREILQHLGSAVVPSTYIVRTVYDDVSRLLTSFKDDHAIVVAAQALLAQLEQPLTAVARWQALEQERWHRLQDLVVPERPETHDLEQLTTRAQQPSDSAHVSYQTEFEHARTEEIAAEREGSTAHVVLEQAHNELSKLEADILRERGSSLLNSIRQTAPHVVSTTDTLATIEEQIRHLSMTLATFGELDPLAHKEYEEVHIRSEHLQEQLRDITQTEQNVTRLMGQLQRDMRHRFTTQFRALQQAFATYFRLLFDGGHAELTLIPLHESAAEETAPVEGIDIMVQPPGKRARHLHLLSGGEKTLTSLALLFAILEVQQPPFIVLDEVDAALDEANSYRFAQLLKTKSATTQCIVITHNRETMAQADVLYGVTMDQYGVSKVYSVKLDDVNVTGQDERVREIAV